MTLMCSNDKIDNLPFAKPSTRAQKADMAVQIDGVIVVRLANGRFLTSARDFHKWAFGISHDLPMREPVVRGLAAIGFITEEEAAEHMAEHRRAKACRDDKFAESILLQYGETLGIADAIAQAIEARRAATLGAVHESAVRQDAPEPLPHTTKGI